MWDFIQFILLLVIVGGLLAAVPVLGIVVGVGVGVWILWKAWEEERNARP